MSGLVVLAVTGAAVAATKSRQEPEVKAIRITKPSVQHLGNVKFMRKMCQFSSGEGTSLTYRRREVACTDIDLDL